MKKLVLCLLFFYPGGWCSGQGTQGQPTELSWSYLHDKQQVFINYYKNFTSFASSHRAEGLGYEIPFNLAAIASMNEERIYAAQILLDIYENMTCEKDRGLVKISFKEQFQHYVELIDFDINSINSALSYTTLPAVSQTAIRMKDDLRDVKAKLDGAKWIAC